MVKYIHDYYKILDVDVDATGDEIKKSYKKAVLKYHPDVNKEDKSGKKFKLIHDAYVVLSDDKKREKYDMLRKVAINDKRIAKRKSDISISKKSSGSNTLDTISKGVEFASTLENDVGLFSNLLNFVSGSNVGKFNGNASFSRKSSAGHMRRRCRKRGRF